MSSRAKAVTKRRRQPTPTPSPSQSSSDGESSIAPSSSSSESSSSDDELAVDTERIKRKRPRRKKETKVVPKDTKKTDPLVVAPVPFDVRLREELEPCKQRLSVTPLVAECNSSNPRTRFLSLLLSNRGMMFAEEEVDQAFVTISQLVESRPDPNDHPHIWRNKVASCMAMFSPAALIIASHRLNN